MLALALAYLRDRKGTSERLRAFGALPASTWILWGAAGLLTLGLLMVYSATSASADGGAAFLKRGIAWAAIGWTALFAFRRMDYRRLTSGSRWILLGAMVLLAGVLIPGLGAQVNGARRWYRLDLLSFQPSELFKFVVPLYLADFLARKADRRLELGRGFLPPLLVLGMSFLLLIAEPDFGTAVLILSVGTVLLLIGGIRARYVGALAALALPVLLFAVLSSPYRMKRMTSFLDPWADPQGKGYQAVQAQVAIGSGGLVGKGIGAGRQKLSYVPAMYSDFILAQVGEELGLAGVTLVMLLFSLLCAGCYRAARDAPDPQGAYLALGVLLTIAIQAIVNVAVVTGMAPTKGISLPLVSYGGSSMVFALAALGVALNIADQAVPADRSGDG